MMVVMPCSAGVARQRERRGGADSPPPGWSPPRSAAPVTASPGTSAAAGRLSWVRRTYYGAGLAITLTQPAPWAPRLAPRGFHYGATLAYLANFALRPFCSSTPGSLTCDPRSAGTYPVGGVVVIVIVAGFGPGPIPENQLFAGGSRAVVAGHRAVSRPFEVAGSLGAGADHAVGYTIDDGQLGRTRHASGCSAKKPTSL